MPHCYPVSETRFRSTLIPESGENRGPERLQNEQVLVAMQSGEPVAFIHTAEDHLKNVAIGGAIRFMMYPPGDRASGQALLDRTVDRYGGLEQIRAYSQHCRYGFYHRSCVYLSDHLGHVQPLLQMNGFERTDGEIFFDWDDYAVDPGESPVDVDVRLSEVEGDGTLPGLKLGGFVDDEEIAACHICACGQWSDELTFQDRLFV